MSELGPDARAILEAARRLDDPTSVDRARVRRSLFARVAAGGATVLVTSSFSATVTAKIVLPIALVVAAGAGASVWWRAHLEGPKAAVAASSVRAAEVAPPLSPEVPTAAAEPDLAAGPVAPARRRAVTAMTPKAADRPPTTTRRLEQETEVLTRVNEALRGDDSRRCLALLDEYDRRFPDGLLREEALATRVIARCRLTPGAGARQDALAFLRQHASSPLTSRVRESCAPE